MGRLWKLSLEHIPQPVGKEPSEAGRPRPFSQAKSIGVGGWPWGTSHAGTSGADGQASERRSLTGQRARLAA